MNLVERGWTETFSQKKRATSSSHGSKTNPLHHLLNRIPILDLHHCFHHDPSHTPLLCSTPPSRCVGTWPSTWSPPCPTGLPHPVHCRSRCSLPDPWHHQSRHHFHLSPRAHLISSPTSSASSVIALQLLLPWRPGFLRRPSSTSPRTPTTRSRPSFAVFSPLLQILPLLCFDVGCSGLEHVASHVGAWLPPHLWTLLDLFLVGEPLLVIVRMAHALNRLHYLVSAFVVVMCNLELHNL